MQLDFMSIALFFRLQDQNGEGKNPFIFDDLMVLVLLNFFYIISSRMHPSVLFAEMKIANPSKLCEHNFLFYCVDCLFSFFCLLLLMLYPDLYWHLSLSPLSLLVHACKTRVQKCRHF